jgi:SAM-dependent methyltransferase
MKAPIRCCLALFGLATACANNSPSQKSVSSSPPEPLRAEARAPAAEISAVDDSDQLTETSDGELTPASRTRGPSETSSVAEPAETTSEATPRTPDVIYVPTPQVIVDKMLDLAKVQRDDVVYDLGCGDGRIVVTAAKKYGARAYGFDIDPKRVAEARANVEKNGVGELVTIEQKDIFQLDLSPASVVTLYLLPSLNKRLLPQLQKLKAGSRVVSHDYDIASVVPVEHLSLRPAAGEREHEIYFWTVPFQRE